jgi:hypothetical protein
MSTYKFRVIFSGLCGFVPRGKKGEELDPKRVDVLLAKTSGGVADSSSFSEYHELSPHIALVQFQTSNLVGLNNKIKTKGFWRLDGDDVTFRLISVNGTGSRELNRGISMKDGRNVKERQPKESKEIPDPDARDRDLKSQTFDFSWLPEMAKILSEDNASVHPDCFSPNPSGLVVARFRLEEGVLMSKDLGAYRGSPIIAQFVPAFGASEYAQALAHRVALEVDVDEGFNVVMEARAFGGDISCSIVLKPGVIVNAVNGDPERGIEVTVSNLCCGNALLDGDSSVESTDTPAPSVDHDFSFMYTLLQGYGNLQKNFILPLPVPIVYEKKKDAGSATGGIRGVECTGCRFPFHLLEDLE